MVSLKKEGEMACVAKAATGALQPLATPPTAAVAVVAVAAAPAVAPAGSASANCCSNSASNKTTLVVLLPMKMIMQATAPPRRRSGSLRMPTECRSSALTSYNSYSSGPSMREEGEGELGREEKRMRMRTVTPIVAWSRQMAQPRGKREARGRTATTTARTLCQRRRTATATATA